MVCSMIRICFFCSEDMFDFFWKLFQRSEPTNGEEEKRVLVDREFDVCVINEIGRAHV